VDHLPAHHAGGVPFRHQRRILAERDPDTPDTGWSRVQSYEWALANWGRGPHELEGTFDSEQFILFSEAARKRLGQEAKVRMAEQYFTGRDAFVSGSVGIGAAKARGNHVPVYARAVAPKPKGLTGQQLWDAVDRMASKLVH
jgi:hypothetical protein